MWHPVMVAATYAHMARRGTARDGRRLPENGVQDGNRRFRHEHPTMSNPPQTTGNGPTEVRYG